MRHRHGHISPHWPQEAPDGVEGPGQPRTEPVALLEHDDEQVHGLEVGQEPGQLLQVLPAGVEAGRVDHRDPRAGLEPEPGSAGVWALQCARLQAVTNMEWLDVSGVVIKSPAQQRVAQTWLSWSWASQEDNFPLEQTA